MSENQTNTIAYQLTINNPEESIHEEIHSAMSFLMPRYYIYGIERGEEKGTLHIHLYIHFGRPSNYFDKLKQLLPRSHIEIAMGSYEQNFLYITKGDKRKVADINDLVENTYYEFGSKPTKPYSYSRYNNDFLIEKITNIDIKLDELIKLSVNSAEVTAN